MPLALKSMGPPRLLALRGPCLGALLLALATSGAGVHGQPDEEPAEEPSQEVVYRTSAQVGVLLEGLRRRALRLGLGAEVERYGESAGGRPLLALRLGAGPATVFVHGGLGRRDAAGTAACLDLAARVVAGEGGAHEIGWLLVPAPNPDALDGFLAGAWPEGGGNVDRDRDGAAGEDGPSDVDGDGEILWMRRLSPRGAWAPAEDAPTAEGKVRGDERLIEEKGPDARRARSYEVWREGLDEDGDGDVGEDPPGTDLLRQFAGWSEEKGPWPGDGPFPGSAPEVRALMELTWAEVGMVAWYGFASEGPRLLRASESGKAADADDDLYGRIGERLEAATGRPLVRASEALAGRASPGSPLDWASAHLGVTAFRLPVWWIAPEEANGRPREPAGGPPSAARPPLADELDWLLWADRVLGEGDGAAFVRWRPFEHPTLGAVQIGGWRRFTRHEPPRHLLPDAVRAVSGAPLVHVPFRPVLAIDLEIEDRGGGILEVRARAHNRGEGPTDTRLSEQHRRSVGVRARFDPLDGVRVLGGPRVAHQERLEPGAVSEAARWLVRRGPGDALGTVRAWHPRTGEAAAEARVP